MQQPTIALFEALKMESHSPLSLAQEVYASNRWIETFQLSLALPFNETKGENKNKKTNKEGAKIPPGGETKLL